MKREHITHGNFRSFARRMCKKNNEARQIDPADDWDEFMWKNVRCLSECISESMPLRKTLLRVARLLLRLFFLRFFEVIIVWSARFTPAIGFHRNEAYSIGSVHARDFGSMKILTCKQIVCVWCVCVLSELMNSLCSSISIEYTQFWWISRKDPHTSFAYVIHNEWK